MEGIAFIESLKEILEDNKIGVNQFAERVACDKAAVRRWLYNMYLPDPETLIRIAVEFKVSVDYLFGFIDKKELELDMQENTFYERYATLKEQHKCTDYMVAKHCVISDGSISKWKAVKSFPSTESLLKLVKYFQCRFDYLLGISGQH